MHLFPQPFPGVSHLSSCPGSLSSSQELLGSILGTVKSQDHGMIQAGGDLRRSPVQLLLDPGQARLLRALSHLILKAFKDGGPRASETGQFLALPPISCAGSCLWSLFYLWCTFCCYSILPFLLLFFVPFLAIPSAFYCSVIPSPFLFFFSVPFSFLPFTLMNRKISSCKVRLRLLWGQGGCCCSRCAGIAARVLVGRVSTLKS